MSGLQSGQVLVGTTATLVCNVPPDPDGVVISSTAPAFVGGPGVSTTTGFTVPANTPITIPTTGAFGIAVYAVVSTGTATVSYAFPSPV